MPQSKQELLEIHSAYLDGFMKVTLECVNKSELKDNPDRLRILFAYFYGPADHFGLEMGLDRKEILENLIPLLNSHSSLAKAEMETAVRLFYDWDEQERMKVMDKGCVSFATISNLTQRPEQVDWMDAENQRMITTVCQELSRLLEEA